MSETKFRWNEPHKLNQQDVQQFIDTFRNHLQPNQIEILEHFKNMIYGFHLQSLNQYGPSMYSNRLKHEATFAFKHFGVKGEITLSY